jgi:integrase
MHAHWPTGQWRRRYKGKDYYFGTIDDPKAALARWRSEWRAIESGRPVVKLQNLNTAGIEDACKDFLAAKLAAMDRLELSRSTYMDYKWCCKRVCDAIGRKTPLHLIGPHDFDAILAGMAHKSPIVRGVLVVKVRTIFRWISDRYPVKVLPPDDFRGPPMKLRREQRLKLRDNTFTAGQIRKLLELSGPVLKAAILLGINGGYGNSDLAAIEPSDVDLKRRTIDHSRGKTGAERKVPLWRRTSEAIKGVAKAGSPKLLTWPDNGLPLVRPGCNDLARRFRFLTDAAGIPGTFYWLRYTFATVAAETGDDHARHIIMGHVVNDVPAGYVLRFPEARLRAVTDHVHDWLFQKSSRGSSSRTPR